MLQIEQLEQELSEAIQAREDAENKLEQVQAQLEEALSSTEKDEKLQQENDESNLRDALSDVFSENQILVDDDEIPIGNGCSDLEVELDELKNKLKDIGIDLTQLNEGFKLSHSASSYFIFHYPRVPVERSSGNLITPGSTIPVNVM